MHELSIAVNIVEIAEDSARNANASNITAIELDIGTQSGVVLEALDLAMKSAVKNSMLENAEIRVNSIPAKARCADCGHVFLIEEIYQECPQCANPFCDVIEGKELRVKKIIAE